MAFLSQFLCNYNEHMTYTILTQCIHKSSSCTYCVKNYNVFKTTLQIDLLQLSFSTFFLFSFLPLSRVLYVVYVSVENYVLYTRLK